MEALSLAADPLLPFEGPPGVAIWLRRDSLPSETPGGREGAREFGTLIFGSSLLSLKATDQVQVSKGFLRRDFGSFS